MARLCHEGLATPQRPAVSAAALADEAAVVDGLLDQAAFDPAARQRIQRCATELISAVRESSHHRRGIEAFLREYDLSSEEGVVLMCLAEALLRIPDSATADRLISDRLSVGDWERHLGRSDSWFVNAATWGLLLTGRIVHLDPGALRAERGLLRRLGSSGEPLVRAALREALRILGQQFVMAVDIDHAISRVRGERSAAARYSFDMLGEAALTADEAVHFFELYDSAVQRIGQDPQSTGDVADTASISIKLSALHPRFEYAQRDRVMAELVPRLRQLVARARECGLAVTVDAEEADRLDLTLDVFAAVFCDPAAAGWHGFGLAVQAYQKRALAVFEWLTALARSAGKRMPLRLVKGAYWDTEIKRAQERGLSDYPVFTRKLATDVSYLACARKLLREADAFYPQFATHNAYSVAAILELAADTENFEFQRLHGMGERLYAALLRLRPGTRHRVYAPVGEHAQLLPYLVRRLLENGANTSFVTRIEDKAVAVETLVRDPVEQLRVDKQRRHRRIPLPVDLFRPLRRNSAGIDLSDPASVAGLEADLGCAAQREYRAAPLIDGCACAGEPSSVWSPADTRLQIGETVEAQVDDVRAAFAVARAGFGPWSGCAVTERARILERAADGLEANRAELIHLLGREGGRCIPDALAEVREAADFCRYYAALAVADMPPRALPAPAGERNQLALHGRGVFACISPWNFPVAIFTGQIAAALVVGNTVVAKPARQTTLCAMRVVQILHQAGVPVQALQFLPGDSAVLGGPMLQHPDLAGVAFTGSTATGHTLNRALALRDGPILPLIAETGGQNAMIVDSSALPEQVVRDVLQSAFNSAGQRCSALRVLFVQEDAAARLLEMLCGAVRELRLGDPMQLCTDVGPVIDGRARQSLVAHREQLRDAVLCEAQTTQECSRGHFVAPAVFEIDRMEVLQGEVFGPMLHVVRYRARELDQVVDAINNSGFGLTLGIHSRIERTARQIIDRARVGNFYLNRNMVGAVVGAQPFGGEGLSGTGPKAGGPHYLQRFAVERVVSVNTAAIGGNATLLSMEDGN